MEALPELVKIRVTESDIEWGERGDGNKCAIAEAVYRSCGYDNVSRVNVGEKLIRLTEKSTGIRYTWATPAPAYSFIRQFDSSVVDRNTELPRFDLDTRRADRKNPKAHSSYSPLDRRRKVAATARRSGPTKEKMRRN